MIDKKNTILVDLIIADNRWSFHEDILNEDNLVRVIDVIIDELNIRNYINSLDISLVLAGDELVRELNKEHRGQDKTTNVLSFPAEEIDRHKLKDLEKLHFESLGDVVFSFDVMTKEAKEQNKEFFHHFVHLFVHGVLHILGFDHIEEDEAKEMENLEVRILEKFSILSPYEDEL